QISIGPGEEHEDPYGTWAELSEIADGGVLLVRPDLYIAYRRPVAPASPEEAYLLLSAALQAVLG
ncbi:MAG TPA: hypothetical protein VFN97_11425, partial [Actinospica sp.]|nr:hypothetical protein [Actinospica sp.]